MEANQTTFPDISDLFDGAVLAVASPLCGRLEDLFPEERLRVQCAVPARQQEFATGRVCARRLLARLGLPAAPVPAGDDRTPQWPNGIVGSIAHTDGLCAAVVALREDFVSVGVDVEPDAPIEGDLWPTICTARELRWVAEHSGREQGNLVRLLFSAKESTYKSLYPVTRTMLEFSDVEVNIDVPAGQFRARIDGERGGAPTSGSAAINGRFATRGGWIFTGTSWPVARPGLPTEMRMRTGHLRRA